MTEMIRARIRVFGRVQGVFFRKYTRDKAVEIGNLFGYVQNVRDGTVEVIVEGEKDRIEALLLWCKTEGSPWSRVREVKVDWDKPMGDLPRFGISY